jgi:uncharacterized membrane protein YdfJ with MMPL/SSD domain
MENWTLRIIRHRKKVLLAWVVLLLLGFAASSKIGDLLTNRFSAPGTEAEAGRDVLFERFGEKGSDGNFTLVFQGKRGISTASPEFLEAANAAVRRAARVVEGAQPTPLQEAGPNVSYAVIATPLEQADAQNETEPMRDAIGEVPGATTYLSGFPAIGEDTEKVYNEDLAQGESIAVPIALLVLAFMFGTLAAMAVPLAFALVSIFTTIGILWIVANLTETATYTLNIVALIGLAIAIDYSMLVVFRHREEMDRGVEPDAALVKAMSTAGRATLFSGLVVAIGLSLLVLMPLPFMRSLGYGGLAVPLVSIAASATFLPALLAVMGWKVNRLRFIPRALLKRRASGEGGFWARLAHAIMRRPVAFLAGSAALMLALAFAATDIEVSTGDNRSVPRDLESTRGVTLLEETIGPGAMNPHQIVVDTGRRGGAFDPATIEAQRKLISGLRSDREIENRTIEAPALATRSPGRPDDRTFDRLVQARLVDREARAFQVRAAGRGDYATDSAEALVDRIRDRYVPAAGFGDSEVLLTGSAAFGVDVIGKAYGAFPWLVAGVLLLTYLLLMRAFRSVFLPLKAVVMNVLSVSAAYGVLVLAFRHGWGEWAGLQQLPEIEFWIPVMLFAMVFGLSMDYEVFLLSRMREEWDKRRDNEQAVAFGLEHTGRIITAAAIIMVAAFSGFLFGSFVGLQQFGLGLAAAIILDATIVRAILVPAFMKLMGRWNWYLPERVRKALRLRPVGQRPVPSPVSGEGGS